MEAALITRAPFGVAPDGLAVELFTLRRPGGIEARICTYGGIIVSLKTPDRNGRLDDVVLGCDDLAGYLALSPYLGALVGRYANRIAQAAFTVDGVKYNLAANNGPNALHGGRKGFDKAVWQAAPVGTGARLVLSYLSKDGEEGYPGNLSVEAAYSLTEDHGLRLDFTATTDKTTVVNLTQHAYFNLAGGGDVLGHEVQIDADRFTPVDATLIPTGELRPVAGTPFDFRQPMAIGARIEQDDEQLKRGQGYDHNFVLNHPTGRLDVVARVREPGTGRVLEVLTTEPGVQLYTGNFLNGAVKGKDGRVYGRRSGFCLEAQHFPDSPNQPAFPPVTLKPGEVFRSTIVFRFPQHG
ncbi:MAG TPA: aldose epimerase family protein [Verrucomicrobiae bacterium]|jgi:aldose 1-epimerase